MTQAERKIKYREALAAEVWRNDEKMVDFCMKQIAYIVELENGGLVALEKPRIKKNFCFGYQLSRYDSESYDTANEMADHAAKSTEYFIEKNMEQVKSWIDTLNDKDGIYSGAKYYKSPDNSVVQDITVIPYWQTPRPEHQPITDKDRAALIAGWKQVGKDFLKRLNSYLKRYGMSKVNTWSYWVDA